jgi:hypothetical protein
MEGERVARKPSDRAELRLRFTEGLRRRLERAAKTNLRSMNHEIIVRLERSFQDDMMREMAVESEKRAAAPQGPLKLSPEEEELFAKIERRFGLTPQEPEGSEDK